MGLHLRACQEHIPAHLRHRRGLFAARPGPLLAAGLYGEHGAGKCVQLAAGGLLQGASPRAVNTLYSWGTATATGGGSQQAHQ
jgi:hypothetical protein